MGRKKEILSTTLPLFFTTVQAPKKCVFTSLKKEGMWRLGVHKRVQKVTLIVHTCPIYLMAKTRQRQERAAPRFFGFLFWLLNFGVFRGPKRGLFCAEKKSGFWGRKERRFFCFPRRGNSKKQVFLPCEKEKVRWKEGKNIPLISPHLPV